MIIRVIPWPTPARHPPHKPSVPPRLREIPTARHPQSSSLPIRIIRVIRGHFDARHRTEYRCAEYEYHFVEYEYDPISLLP